MDGQDWETVTLSKTQKQKTAGLSTARALSAAKAAGVVETEKRHAVAASATTGISLKKLEDSTEEFKHATVSASLSKAIAQARQAKKMTQAQLATAINERAQIIQEYESGKAIPNPSILNKLDRALGIHLPRGKK